MTDQTVSEVPANPMDHEFFKIYVDVYKHHFELWLKGYFVYLAVAATAAGFVFKEGTSVDAQRFLILFVATVSVISCIAWLGGLKWLRVFAVTIERVAPVGSPPLALSAFRLVIVLGFVGAIVICSAAILLYFWGL